MGHQSNERLTISPAGISLVKKWEGWSAKAYKDPVGVWTIGWGTIGPEARPGRKITKKQGEEFLRRELAEQEGYVKHYVRVPLTQHQFDALVSLVYNIGAGNFSRSTLLKLVNRGNFSGAAAQFARHNTARDRETGKRIVLRGLTNRRLEEALLFQLPDDQDPPWAIDVETPAELTDPNNYDGNIQPEEPEAESGAAWKVLTESGTFKALATAITGLIMAISQLLEPIKDNPILFISVLTIISGVVAALYIKTRDTAEGR